MDEEISLKMADIRSFRDNYLENMELQKQDRRPRRKRRKGKFGQWKESVLNQCESDQSYCLKTRSERCLPNLSLPDVPPDRVLTFLSSWKQVEQVLLHKTPLQALKLHDEALLPHLLGVTKEKLEFWGHRAYLVLE